jgi:hypothetical protein
MKLPFDIRKSYQAKSDQDKFDILKDQIEKIELSEYDQNRLLNILLQLIDYDIIYYDRNVKDYCIDYILAHFGATIEDVFIENYEED